MTHTCSDQGTTSSVALNPSYVCPHNLLKLESTCTVSLKRHCVIFPEITIFKLVSYLLAFNTSKFCVLAEKNKRSVMQRLADVWKAAPGYTQWRLESVHGEFFFNPLQRYLWYHISHLFIPHPTKAFLYFGYQVRTTSFLFVLDQSLRKWVTPKHRTHMAQKETFRKLIALNRFVSKDIQRNLIVKRQSQFMTFSS